MTLRLRYGVRIAVFGHVRNDLLTETVGDIHTVVVGRQFARVGLELFVECCFRHNGCCWM